MNFFWVEGLFSILEHIIAEIEENRFEISLLGYFGLSASLIQLDRLQETLKGTVEITSIAKIDKSSFGEGECLLFELSLSGLQR